MAKRGQVVCDYVGRRFGRLKVLRLSRIGSHRNKWWWCSCDCGAEKEVGHSGLQSGGVNSCGCLQRELVAKRMTKHGLNRRGKKDPLYVVWRGVIGRATQVAKGKHREWYFARGITVCSRWRDSVEAFVDDMGPRPEKMSVERIDNDKGYWCGKPECPECGPLCRDSNCRWATATEQARNTRRSFRLTWRGETRSVGEWSSILGLSRDLIYRRLHRQLPLDAVFRPRLLLPERAHLRESYRKDFLKQTKTIWAGMLRRCYDSSAEGFKNYGGRGIRVCPSWQKSFDAFLKDVGVRPSLKHSIDRFPDPTGDYEPANVRWATQAEQAANMRPTRASPRQVTPRVISEVVN